MTERIKKLMENQRKRTAFIISAMSVLIAAVMIFIGLELGRNQSLYINNFMNSQQKYVDQIALRFSNYRDTQGLPEDTAIANLISEVSTSGNSYWFVAGNEELIFVKDNITTDLYKTVTLDSFLQENSSEDFYVIKQSVTISDINYVIGNCVAKSFIIDDGQLFKHNIYVIMPLILICSIILVIAIFSILMINRQESQIVELKKEAIERNMAIEQLTTRIKKTRMNDFGRSKTADTTRNDKQIYNKEVLGSLLAKINRENIVPLSIIIIELSSKNKIYSAEEYQDYVKTASTYLTKEHVLAEIIPGIFTVLMFHTSSENMESIKKTLINEWALPLKKNGIKVRMGITCIDNYDSNVENVFDLVYREVSGINGDNQIRRTS